jgi:IS605 OrfB family transposase
MLAAAVLGLLLPSLESNGLKLIKNYEELSEKQAKYVDKYFEREVYPVLTPMAVDSSRPFPLISNKTLNIGALIYDKKKKMWILNLVYNFDNKSESVLDKNRILGVDLGIHYPICASVYGEWNRFTIDGGEIENFRKKVEARKKSMLRQGKNCGDGRIGHGISARNKPVYKIEDKIAKFRDTANHKYSHALIQYAIKNNCGVIQMEDLTGITNEADRFLKNWSYYDLQTKIKYKAKEVGIDIVYIKPKYTSQRCSKCGYIDKENRNKQASFVCLKCGFKANADYNASQNISIKDIDKLIEEMYNSGANTE